MKLGYARIFVNDLKGAVEFYRDTLGLEPAWEVEGQHAGFNTGDCTLLLEPLARRSPSSAEASSKADGEGGAHGEAQKLFTALSFTVKDIQAEHKRLTEQGVEFTPCAPKPSAKAGPTKMEWGGTLAYFKDPEGHIFGLVSVPWKLETPDSIMKSTGSNHLR